MTDKRNNVAENLKSLDIKDLYTYGEIVRKVYLRLESLYHMGPNDDIVDRTMRLSDIEKALYAEMERRAFELDDAPKKKVL